MPRIAHRTVVVAAGGGERHAAAGVAAALRAAGCGLCVSRRVPNALPIPPLVVVAFCLFRAPHFQCAKSLPAIAHSQELLVDAADTALAQTMNSLATQNQQLAHMIAEQSETIKSV